MIRSDCASWNPSPTYIGSKLDLRIDGDDANSVMNGFGWDILPQQPFKLSKRFEVTKDGLLVEKGTLLTIADAVLEASGFIAFDRGGKGTGLDFELNEDNLSDLKNFMATGNVLDIFVPGQPYRLTGRFVVDGTGWETSPRCVRKC